MRCGAEFRVKSVEFRFGVPACAGTFFIIGRKAFPLWGKVARNAPDEGEMSGSCPLISHLR